MAVATASGGLLLAAAGTVPAYASTPAVTAPPPGAHTVTSTTHPTAQAASGIGPQATLPYATKGASCVPQTITCTLSADVPFADDTVGEIAADAEVECSRSVPETDLHEALLKSGVSVNVDSYITPDGLRAGPTVVGAACLAGTYANTADALITFPPATS